MDFSTIKLFDDESGKPVTFDTLLKDIYTTSRSKRVGIQDTIALMVSKIKTPIDAAEIGKVVADYLEVGVKNDDQLIKLAQIVQRATSPKTGASAEKEYILSDEEILELRQEATLILDSNLSSGKEVQKS